jgi:hypothetical protein
VFPQWRSGYERRLREDLDRAEVLYYYERDTYKLTLKVPNHFCKGCGGRDILKVISYTPDFYFPETDLTVEAKGKFDAKARKLALAWKEQYPDKRYALIFQRDNWISSKKAQKYSQWAEKADILFAVGNKIPKGWYALESTGGL